MFSKSYSNFPISAIFGEFGVNFIAIFGSKSVGMLFNSRALQKMFSFIEKVFSKVIVDSEFQPTSGNLGLFFGDFARKISVGILFNLRGLEKSFLLKKKCFPNL